MATLVNCKSWKAMMDAGQDPSKGTFFIFRVDSYMWLHRYKPCILSTASREFGIVRGLHHRMLMATS